MPFKISITTNQSYNGSSEFFAECEILETPNYLQVTDESPHLKNTRFIFPWHTITRAVIEELPPKD